MATSTIRTDVRTVKLAVDQLLEYHLKISGARANFAWVDDDGNTVLTHMNFGTPNELVWQLKPAGAPAGKIGLSVPQNPAYARVESPGTATEYLLALGFVTAVGYTLTVKLRDAAGVEVKTLTDIDFKMTLPADIVDQPLTVTL